MTTSEARSEILHLWTHLPPNDRRELIATLKSSMSAEQLRTPKPPPSISEERRAREEFVRRAQQYKVDSYAGRRRRF